MATVRGFEMTKSGCLDVGPVKARLSQSLHQHARCIQPLERELYRIKFTFDRHPYGMQSWEAYYCLTDLSLPAHNGVA